jgi:nucleotide-binding universal stress UspA family protein
MRASRRDRRFFDTTGRDDSAIPLARRTGAAPAEAIEMTFQPGFLVSIVVILLAARLLGEAVRPAAGGNQRIRVRSRPSADWQEAILSEAARAGATLIVLGVTIRPSDAMLFGETADHLLEASPRSLLFVAS